MSFGLYTDLYELTMAAGYWRAGLTGRATFELFVRRLPPNRSYLVAAGLGPALDYLAEFKFDSAAIEWLRQRPQFRGVPSAFFDDYLRPLRFTGDVWGVREGTAVFANEPMLRVTAPIGEAQIVETALLAITSFATSVATKASRIVAAAAGRPVIEFGARRAHGLAAGLDAARAAFVGGCEGTSFVEAGRRFEIPTSGTMAHSWVQAFATQAEAFTSFDAMFGDAAVYLLDTYDTVAAARWLAASAIRPAVVRIDSGDLLAQSRAGREVLDSAGLVETKIFATSDLDEYAIARLVAAGAPIDGFGVGTSLSTVSDAPSLSAVYKLVEVDRGGVRFGVVKLSEHKETWPGPKQVWRIVERGEWRRDVIAAADEPAPDGGTPLLERVMHKGEIELHESLAAAQARCRATIAALPRELLRLEDAGDYRVDVSRTLEERRQAIRRGVATG